MFTFRLSSYQIIQYLLIFFALSEVIAKQTTFECAAAGEYCLNHWDCCSNACMSYLYRCARGHGIYPYPFLGISYKPTVTLEQILEQNFGNPNALSDYHDRGKPYLSSHSGNGDNIAASGTKIVLEKGIVEPSTSETPVDLKDISLMLNTLLDSTTLKNAIDLNLLESSISTNSVEKLEETTTSTERYLSEERTESLTDSASAVTVKKTYDKQPPCAKIGEKCYHHEDCCDKLCHGYLHQCVT